MSDDVARDAENDARAEIYARGHAPFMGREFFVEPGTLIPREVSAILVSSVVELVRSGALAPSLPGQPLRFIDQCGGSGNVGCLLALEVPEAHVWSTDLMPASSALARRNVDKHDLAARVRVATGDLFRALDGLGLDGTVDVVTCSPPFISTGRLAKDRAFLLAHEPREAFDAGPYGIAMHMRLVKESLSMLRPGGYLVLEFGEGQAKQVEGLATRSGGYDEVRVLADAAGVARAICARKAVAAPTGV